MDDSFLTLKFGKSFPGFELAVDATFSSAITAIFGPSGSGKTTMLNCIAGTCSPDGGEIALAGQHLYSSSAKAHVPPERRRVGYVFQDGLLFPHLTVQGNIDYGFKLTPREQRRIAPEQLIDLLELAPLLDRRPDGLSGGERQRVALARALATSPSLLLLDEPLGSLDMGFRGRILRYLKALHQELSIPMVYVSHSISEVLAIAHQALVLSQGQQIAFDEPRQVLLEPRVQSLVETGSLENLLDVEVIERLGESGTMVTRLGDTKLLVPHPPPGADQIREGDTISLAIRAGDIIISVGPPGRLSARNILPVQIGGVHRVGGQVLVYTEGGAPLVAEITPDAASSLDLQAGQEAYLIIKSSSIMVLD